MGISHLKSNTIPDFTGTVTVFDSNGLTQTRNATDVIRPSDWNASHAMLMPLLGNTSNASSAGGSNLAFSGGPNITLIGSGSVLGFSGPDPVAQTVQTQSTVQVQGSTGSIEFANSNGVTFGGNAGTITASHNGLTTQSGQAASAGGASSTFQTLGFVDGGGASWSTTAGGVRASVRTDYANSSHSHGNPTLALTNLTGTTASNSAGLTLSLSAAPPGAGAALSAGTQSASSGTVVFANSNGMTFGMSGSSQITASYTVPNTAGLISRVRVSAGTTSNDLSAVTFANANGVSFGLDNGTLTASITPAGGAQTAISGLANSETTYTSGTVGFSALGALTIRSTTGQQFQFSVNPQSTQPAIQSLSAGTTRATTGEVVFSNSNGMSFGLNGNTLTGSYTVPAVTNSSWTVSDAASSATVGRLAFTNLNGLTLSLSTGAAGLHTIVGSHNGLTTAAQVSHSHGNPTLALTNILGTTASASNGLTLSLSVAAQSVQPGVGAVAAGTQTATSGTVVFANSNGISFGLSGSSQITASYTVPAQTQFVLSNSNNVSFGTNGSTVTASASFPAQTAQTVGLYASSQTYGQSSSSTVDARSVSFVGSGGVSVGFSGGSVLISGQTTAPQTSFVLSNSNNVSFGTNGSTVTASASFSQSVQAAAIYASSQTYGQSSSSAVDLRSLTIVGQGGISAGLSGGSLVLSGQTTAPQTSFVLSNSNNVSFGTNGSTVTASASFPAQTQFVLSASNGIAFGTNGSTVTASYTVPAVPAQTAQTLGIYASSQTFGQSSSSTVDARSLSVVGSGGISVGLSAGTLLISGQTTAAQTQFVLSNSNNVSFGTNGSTVTASASFAQSAQTQSNVQGLVAGTQTGRTGDISFADSNGISFGMSGSSRITASYTVPGATVFSNSNNVSFGLAGSTVTASATFAQSNQVLTLSAVSNTTQSASGTVNASAVSFAGAGGVSVGITNGSVVISGGAGGGGSLNVSAGTTSGNVGSLVFSNSNGVSFGLNGSTVTASANPGVSQIQNSNTTYVSGGVILSEGGGAITIASSTGQAFRFSVPQTSSLSATGQVSISVNGSTISIGVPNASTKSGFSPYADLNFSYGTLNDGVVIFDPCQPGNVQFDRVCIPIHNQNSSNSTGSHTLSFHVGFYSRNGSSLSLVASTSASTALTQSGTAGSYSLFSGLRLFTFPWTRTMTEGQYWLAFMSRSSSAGAAGSYTMLQVIQATNLFVGIFGSAHNTSQQITLGQGILSSTTTQLPSSVGFSQIRGSDSQGLRAVVMYFASSTV